LKVWKWVQRDLKSSGALPVREKPPRPGVIYPTIEQQILADKLKTIKAADRLPPR